MKALLNIDAGEHADEPEELYALADVVHIACGGHAGDEASMTRVAAACVRSKTRIGAHPSYVDREGFGRRTVRVTIEALRSQIEDQMARLRAVAENAGTVVGSVKLHGALYHDAHRRRDIAEAVVVAVKNELPAATLVGPAGGALARAASGAGLAYWREAFADRGTSADGTLVPRGEPGALVTDPEVAASIARTLAAKGDVETICIHADTPSSLAIARSVRAALGPRC